LGVFTITARCGRKYSFNKGQQHLIGQGRFGCVYKAANVDKPSDVVAVKLIPDELVRNRLRRKALRLEYAALCDIKHRNLAEVYDLVERPRLCLVLEYIDGKDLREIIGSKEPYTFRQKLRVMTKTLKGLECLHKNNIFHGDLKPDNIVVNLPDVKLLDYGVCQLGQPGDNLWSRMKNVLGATDKLHTFGASPAYMAPEQIDKAPLTACSDIYSTGMSFIFWFSGADYPVFPIIGLEKEGIDDRRLGNLYMQKKRSLDPVAKRVIQRTLNDHKQSDIIPFHHEVSKKHEPRDERRLRNEIMRILFKMVRRDETGKLGRRNTRERERYFFPTYYSVKDIIADLEQLRELSINLRKFPSSKST